MAPNPDVFPLLFQTSVYVVFAIVAYFTESGQEFAPKSIHELRWVILDTFAALYVYGVFRFREGIANQAYGIESKKETNEEPLIPPANAAGKLRNAVRTAGNALEQLPIFLISMYMYAFVRPFLAGIFGAIEIVLYIAYPFVFGCFGKKPGPLLQLSTIPRYMLNEYMMVASIMTLFDLVRATEKV
mmetsp:Transcript_20664/g.33315  ORF Transcript_20664/g.33315 Transcript_20664/m.33315 type:complete len:186 (+) Transcript_20664:157-714(+)